MDERAAQLGGLGSSVPGSSGSSRQDPTCFAWRVGIFGQLDLLSWLGLRVEPGFGVWNGRWVAIDDAGRPFDRYGLWFYGFDVPLLARFLVPFGSGRLLGSAGAFAAIAVGKITTVDQYADASGLAVFPSAGNTGIFWGLAAGMGYWLPLPKGSFSIELRMELALHPALGSDSQAGGEALFSRVTLGASYGFQLAGHAP
jgi:hypothetical protein